MSRGLGDVYKRQFLSYVLSFIYLGIYWNNHHHLLHAAEHIDGSILWANLHLLFWLSLVPFVTGWMGENHFAALPAAVYGMVMFMAAIAYVILQTRIVKRHGKEHRLATALGSDLKGKLSMTTYLAAIGLAFVDRRIAFVLYVAVAAMWLVPDRRIERTVR